MRLIKRTLTILVLTLALTALLTVKIIAADTVPRRLNYQGRLMDSSDNLLTGSYYICFSIWDNATVGAGSQVWPAGTPTPTAITTSNGVFSAEVGSADALNIAFNSYDYYLQVYVNTTNSCSSGGETLSPRQHLTSAAYSINADMLDGADAGTGANNVLLLDAQGDINLIDNAIIYGDGMYARDAGGLKLYDDGGNGLFIQDGGNVGIGTTNPDKLLEITQPAATSDYGLKLTVIRSAPDTWTGIQFWDDSLAYQTAGIISRRESSMGAHSLVFSTNLSGAMSEHMVIKSSGNVGIGTTSPDKLLEITLPSSTNNYALKLTNNYNNSNTWTGIQFWDDILGYQTAGIISKRESTAGKHSLIFSTNDSGTNYDRLAINSNGNVGIGTTAPNAPLDVKSNALTTLGGIRLENKDDVNIAATIYEATTGDGALELRKAGDQSIRFLADGDSYINGGNVGIGTTAPDTLLELRQTTADHRILSINRPNSDTAALYIGNDSSNNAVISANNVALRFGKDVGGTLTEYMRLNTNGSFSIGTTASTYSLDIKGQSGVTDFFRIQNYGGNNIFTVSDAQANFYVPTSFNTAGDVEIAYDLYMSNSTASTISSNSSLYIEAGDSFEAQDVVIRSAGSGDVVVDDDLLVSSSLYIAGNERFNSSGALIPHTVSATTKFTNLNADLLDGYDSSESSTGSTVAVRNGSGDINSRLFRSEYDTTNATIGYIMTQVDTVSNNYIRPSTPAQVISALGLLTENQTITLSGDVTGSGTTAITTAVVDDSHNHVYSNIDATTSANWAGRITDETGTGLFVLATSPTFTTDIRTPKVIGGTATTSDLYLQTTTGIGTTGADMHFLVGNNGGREAITILNDGSVGIFNTSPTYQLHVYNDGKVTGPGVMIQSEANIASLHFATAALTWATGVYDSYDSSTVGVDDGTYRIGRGIDWATAIDFKIGTGGEVFMPQVYGDYFSTGRDLYISSTGQLGYISSSIRYKENVIDINDVGWLYDLRPVEFDFIADGVHSWGLIAEEVENVQKELVSYNEQGTPETVQYSYLVTPLLKAIQNQNHEIELLKEKQGNVYVYDDSAILVAIEEQKLRIDALEELSPLAQMLELSSEGELVLKAEYKLTVKSDIQVEGNIISANAGHSFIPLMVTENLPIDVQNQERNLTEEELLAFEQVKIENGSIDGNTQIMITATTPLCGNNLYVLGKETNIGFTVTLEKENTCEHDIEFDWWLVKSIDEQKNPS